MPADSHAFDPYRSPSMPEVPYVGPPPAGRPGWLTTLCVLCIVMGALGLVNSAFGTLGMIVGKKLQQTMAAQPQPGMPADLQEAQQKMQDEMYAVQDKYFVPLALGIVFRLVAGTLLVVGGIRTLGFSEPGRKLLLVACSVALVFEALQAVLQCLIAMENMSVMHGFMEVMAGKNSKMGDMEGLMTTVMSVVRIFSLVMIGAIALSKIALYTFGLVYLRKPHIMARFQTDPSQSVTPTPAI